MVRSIPSELWPRQPLDLGVFVRRLVHGKLQHRSGALMQRADDIAQTAAFFDRAIRDIAACRSAGQPDVLDVRVLDFGCGAGQLVERMSRLGYDAHGCDIYVDPAASDRCRKIELSPYRLPFADDSFDIVYAPYLISVVPDPVAVAREMRRVCRPGGRIIFLNHFRSPNPLLAWIERGISPFTVPMVP